MSSRAKRDAFFNSNIADEPTVSLSVTCMSESHKPTTSLSNSSFVSSRRGVGNAPSDNTSFFSTPVSGNLLLENGINCISADEIGFANLPNQIYRDAVSKGFDFNILVVGCSGLGKSTFINSLFLSELYSVSLSSNSSQPLVNGVSHHITNGVGYAKGEENIPGTFLPTANLTKTVKINSSCFLLKENGVDLRVRLVDTPGFGDAINNSNCWQSIITELESRFDHHMRLEQSLERTNSIALQDRRLHCCLYFIEPTGHCLRDLDIEVMRRLQDKVNVIPLIAKADSLTREECTAFKRKIQEQLISNNIQIYDFPESEIMLIGDVSEQTKNKSLAARQPFAVVGSNCLVTSPSRSNITQTTTTNSSQPSRGRVYAWGVVEVDNLDHNDFMALRTLLMGVHMRDLIESTNSKHYESHRRRCLMAVVENTPHFDKDPLLQLDEERVAFDSRMAKSRLEMDQLFEQKLREKKNTLKELELSNQRRFEQMQKQLEKDMEELEERLKLFEQEKQTWDGTWVSSTTGDSPGNTFTSSFGGVGVGSGSPSNFASTLPVGVNATDLKQIKPEKKKKGLF